MVYDRPTLTGAKLGCCQKNERKSLESVCTHANLEMNKNCNTGFSAEVKHDKAKHQAVACGSSSMPMPGTLAQAGGDTALACARRETILTRVAHGHSIFHYNMCMWTQESSCKTNTLTKILHDFVRSQNTKLPFGCIWLEVQLRLSLTFPWCMSPTGPSVQDNINHYSCLSTTIHIS